MTLSNKTWSAGEALGSSHRADHNALPSAVAAYVRDGTWGLFAPASGDVGIKYASAGDTYQFLIPITASKYWGRKLRRVGSVGDGSVHFLNEGDVVTVSGSTVSPSEETLQPGFSAEEYAHQFYKTGDSSPGTLMGNSHGEETEDSFSVTVDGVAWSPNDGDIAWGSEIVAARVTRLLDPEDNETDAADVTTTYTVNSSGLTVSWELTWQLAGTVSISYPAMVACDDLFDRATFNTATRDYDVSGSTANLFQARARVGYVWKRSGNYACAVRLVDPVVAADDFAAAATQPAFVDGTASVTKVYFARVGSTPEAVSVSVNDEWSSEQIYRVAYFDDPDLVLGKG